MKALVTKLRRALLMFQIRTLEADIDGYGRALESLSDTDLRLRVDASRNLALHTLSRLRGEYTATFLPGTRFTWGYA